MNQIQIKNLIQQSPSFTSDITHYDIILTYDISHYLLSAAGQMILIAFLILFFYTKLRWTLLLSRPLSFTVSSVASLYYSSPPLPGYLYQLLPSLCLSALLAASVYTNTDISTCMCSFGLPGTALLWILGHSDTVHWLECIKTTCYLIKKGKFGIALL